MDHPLRLQRRELDLRPWRAAVLALAAIAAVELVLLVLAGGALLAGPHGATATAHRTTPAKAARPAAASTSSGRDAAAALPRRKVSILVLNGNGRQGAAGRAAARASRRGYRITSVANAPAAAYPQSLVMYRPGFAPEGRRLAQDMDVAVVAPLDGMRPAQLHGAHAILILGG